MAALPENDRIAGPFLAVAGQVDFPADFPLINAAGLRVRRERGGVAVVLSGAAVSAVNMTEAGFTCRLAAASQVGDRLFVYSELPAARSRSHALNGAVRTATLEGDATDAQAQLQEVRRDQRRAVQAPFGEAGLNLPSVAVRKGRLMAFDAEGLPDVSRSLAAFDAAVVAMGEAVIAARNEADRSRTEADRGADEANSAAAQVGLAADQVVLAAAQVVLAKAALDELREIVESGEGAAAYVKKADRDGGGNITSPGAWRTALGLGDAATKDTGVAFGVASLGADAKVPTSLLPDAVLGALKWQGVWNAATNSPAIPAAAAGNRGWYYKVSVSGTTSVSGIADWEIGDWVVSNGATWDKIDNTDQVMSVAGLKGIITAGDLKTALAIAIGDVAGLQAALDAKADLTDSFVTVTTTTYTLLLANLGKVHRFTHASGCTVTLPNSFPAGWNFLWRQCAAGAVTFNAQAGGTRVNRSSHTKSAGLGAEGSLSVDTNSGANAAWWLSGDTAA
ncbi:MAG: hypothetical protein ACREEY_04690 [Brevundimonas sp.]